MLTLIDNHIVRTVNGRITWIVQITEQEQYQALIKYGVREVVASAIVKGLITLTVKTS